MAPPKNCKPENRKEKNADILLEAAKKAKVADGLFCLKGLDDVKSPETDEIKFMLRLISENEKIQRRFHELESKILSILNFQDFFEILLTGMENIFNVPYVWLSVIKRSSLANLINPLYDSKIIIEKTKFINRSDFNNFFGNIASPVLISSNLAPYAFFMPRDKKYRSGSMAVAPVEIDGEIVGSLNQWDHRPDRFEPDMDTSSLEQLMIKISLCLSNVAAHEKLKRYAFHDPLTGLPNRRAFENALNREFSRAKRHSLDLSLVFLDLDNFKWINDCHGHDAGDDALVYVAETLQSIVREEDMVARFAGDEFVIILPETATGKTEKLMHRIQQFLKHHPLSYKDVKISISLSYGITAASDPEIDNPSELLKKSDERLYAEKERKKMQAGSNRSGF
jgi:diguanylate cyclase (GGDEF)-like protein